LTEIALIEIKALTPNRYVVEVKKNDGKEKITVMSETLIALGLFKPRVLTIDEYQTLKASGVIDELKSKAIHFLAFRARLTSEVVTFLEKKEELKTVGFKYHVSQNKDAKSNYYKQWRVRKEGSSKTIKYFETQAEAIDFAEDLAKKMIHLS